MAVATSRARASDRNVPGRLCPTLRRRRRRPLDRRLRRPDQPHRRRRAPRHRHHPPHRRPAGLPRPAAPARRDPPRPPGLTRHQPRARRDEGSAMRLSRSGSVREEVESIRLQHGRLPAYAWRARGRVRHVASCPGHAGLPEAWDMRPEGQARGRAGPVVPRSEIGGATRRWRCGVSGSAMRWMSSSTAWAPSSPAGTVGGGERRVQDLGPVLGRDAGIRGELRRPHRGRAGRPRLHLDGQRPPHPRPRPTSGATGPDPLGAGRPLRTGGRCATPRGRMRWGRRRLAGARALQPGDALGPVSRVLLVGGGERGACQTYPFRSVFSCASTLHVHQERSAYARA